MASPRHADDVQDPDDGEVLGTVTSGLLSPTLGHPVALALLRPWCEDAPAWPVGTALAADVQAEFEKAGGAVQVQTYFDS